MPFAGKTMMARNVTNIVAPLWPNRKVEAVSVAGAESHLSVGAYHDNLNADGEIVSRDCGLFQINIPARLVGTQTELELRTESTNPDVYTPIAAHNARVAHDMFKEREWQPWVAYTTGWALFPEAWVWHRERGEPVGPWVATGRYLHQAIRGVANWHWLYQNMDPYDALREAERLADIFGVPQSTTFSLEFDRHKGVFWHYPPKPDSPPADGKGKYPVPNDGRSYLSTHS